MITIIFGPTASGKTALSIELAKQQKNSVIINCDSIQVYRDLPILSASPTQEEKSQAKHKMFEFLDYDEKISGVDWANMAQKLIKTNENVVIVGGTFLYIEMLLNGISELPEISQEVRNKVDEDVSKNGITQIYEELCQFDPRFKSKLNITMHHQIKRSYEIFLETNRSIIDYHQKQKIIFIDEEIRKKHKIKAYNIRIDRCLSYNRIDKRFSLMIESGAIQEVENLLAKTNRKKDYPIFSTIGAKEIASYLEGAISLDQAIEISCIKSKQYAKRQITWIRNRLKKSTNMIDEMIDYDFR